MIEKRKGQGVQYARPQPWPKMPPEIGDYFSELLMASKFELSLLPRPLTAVMIAIAMPAAIRPYSMAVAPDSSFTKRETRFFIDDNSCVHVAGRLVFGVLST